MSGLIPNPDAIWLAVAPVDMRRGIDGLSLIVQEILGHAPCSGAAFIFHNRPGTRVKVVIWDGTGVWCCQRRLHQGRFIWPTLRESSVQVTLAQWHWLIAGVDWQRLSAVPNGSWRV